MHEDIKIITGNTKTKNSNGCIKDKNGKVIFEKDKALERWSEYIGDLFSDNRPALPSPSNLEGPPILQEEFKNAIRKSRIGKAPGEDGITTEMIKAIGQFGIEKLSELYNNIYGTGHIP